MTIFTPPPHRPVWQSLVRESNRPQPLLREMLQDPLRRQNYQASGAGLTLDYSRQGVTDGILQQLFALAQEADVMGQARAVFRGEHINITEDRAVLHVALRGSHLENPPWGEGISRQIAHELDRFCQFAERVRSAALMGYADTPITDVVNLGIGGSDLGPRMTTEALGHLDAQSFTRKPRLHFVSNVDAWSLYTTLATLEPSRTAFIVQSKSFTTPETLTLAASARRWLQDAGCPAERIAQHMIAVTACPDLARSEGFLPEQTFEFWDWVGGRYSIWSAIGLPLAMVIGADAFRSFLQGGRAMDEHFLDTPANRNLPLLMALLGIWNHNFLGASSHLVAPYAAPLSRLHVFLQQMEMESNGKHTHVDGSTVEIDTAPIVWGGLGIDGQHAYFQLLHQGRYRIPIDFLGVRTEPTPLPLASQHHHMVLNNMQAQAEALAIGRTREETRQLLQAQGLSPDEIARLETHRTYPGNAPSNTLWLEALTPHSMGALIALYEHKVFCQAAIWGICAYDQWGVELGKTLAQAMTN